MNTLYIFLGCGLGGLARYWFSNLTHVVLGRGFPYGTLFVNVTGSLLMGLLFIVVVERVNGQAGSLRALLLIGFLGGYTTFSAYSIETLNLIESGQTGAAVMNTILSVLLCLMAVWLGIKIGRMI